MSHISGSQLCNNNYISGSQLCNSNYISGSQLLTQLLNMFDTKALCHTSVVLSCVTITISMVLSCAPLINDISGSHLCDTC